MERKYEVCQQNFTKDKAIQYLCSVEQCVKLSFMIKKFEKMKRSNGIELFKFSILKRY